MKKLLFLLLLLPLWVSCSKDDDTQDVNKKKTCLPKTINLAENLTTLDFDINGRLVKEHFRDHNSKPTIFNYGYINDKLSEITETNYLGDQIVYSVTTDNSGKITEVANPDRTRIYAFVYDNNSRLTKFTRSTNGQIDQHRNYTYNGSIITFAEGLVVEVDSNPNPFKYSIHNFVFRLAHFQNNPLKTTEIKSDGSNGDQWYYQYTYNSEGFPTSGKMNYSSGGYVELTFDYNCK